MQLDHGIAIWYTKKEIGFRMAYWFGFAAVAGCVCVHLAPRCTLISTYIFSAFGGLIAFGIQNANVNVETWRLLFIVEGCPSVLLGLLAMWLLPDRPEETSFLNEAERELQLERINRGITADVGRTVNKAHIVAAFKDWRVSGILMFTHTLP